MIRSADMRMLQPGGYTGWPTHPISGTKDRWYVNISAVLSKQVRSGIQNQTPQTGFVNDLASAFRNRPNFTENPHTSKSFSQRIKNCRTTYSPTQNAVHNKMNGKQ